MNNPRKYFPSIITIVTMIFLVGGVIWAGSKIDSKAEEAHTFVRENVTLPARVCTLEEKAKKAEMILENIDVMQFQQQMLVNDLDKLTDRIERALNGQR